MPTYEYSCPTCGSFDAERRLRRSPMWHRRVRWRQGFELNRANATATLWPAL